MMLKSFNIWLTEIEQGGLNASLSNALQNVVSELNDHVQAFGGVAKGSLTLKLDFKNEDGIFEIRRSIKTKMPDEKSSPSIFWSDGENNLIKENPKQSSFNYGDKTVAEIHAEDKTA